ncbi:hypothetical protein [Nocardia sp. CNY236]|uniref:hypothetical protein n=1 Tax=Nocardia sp. CNY236 TaxID=1169152 RepID=UPI0012DC89F4|nr:hypothetical protein [Nocardia sp. CNY236]
MSPFTRMNQSRSPLLYLAIAAVLLILIVAAALAIATGGTHAAAMAGEQAWQIGSRQVADLG